MKKIIIMSMTAVMFMIFSSCDSKEQAELNQRNIITSKRQTVRYINDKYGFEPEFIDSYADQSGALFGIQSNNCYVHKCSHGDETFTVYADCTGEQTKFCDNYQSDTIRKAVSDEIKKQFPECFYKAILYSGKRPNCYQSDDDDRRPMYKVYFDGNNLPDVLTDYGSTIEVILVNADLSDENYFEFVDKLVYPDSSYSMEFISCRSGADAYSVAKIFENSSGDLDRMAQNIESYRIIASNTSRNKYTELEWSPDVEVNSK